MLRKTTVPFCLLLLTYITSASYIPLPPSPPPTASPAVYVANGAPYADDGPPFPTALCQECEEEIWEEIPCEQLTTTTTTTTLAPPSTTTTTITTTTTTTSKPTPMLPTTTPPTTTLPPVITTTTASPVIPPVLPPEYVTPTAPSPDLQYKSCYCDCKVGCKEFCRKVVASASPKQQITQSSKTIQKLPGGQVETMHVHQRKFVAVPYAAEPYVETVTVPTPVTPQPQPLPAVHTYPIENSEEIDNLYQSPQPAYNAAATYTGGHGVSYYTNALVDTPSYSLDDITKLLASAAHDFNNQPQFHYPQAHYPQAHPTAQAGYQPTYPANPNPNYNAQAASALTHSQPPCSQTNYKPQDKNAPTENQPKQPQTNYQPQDTTRSNYGNTQYPQPSNLKYAQQPSHSQCPYKCNTQYSESTKSASYPIGAPLNIVPPQLPHHYAQMYSKVLEPNDASYANNAPQKAAIATSGDNSESLSANYISKQESHIEADNSNSQYPTVHSVYSAPSLNEHPLFDFTLDSYFKNYDYPF